MTHLRIAEDLVDREHLELVAPPDPRVPAPREHQRYRLPRRTRIVRLWRRLTGRAIRYRDEWR